MDYALTVRRAFLIILPLLVACGPSPNVPHVSKEPVSVRGWIADVAGSPRAANAELDGMRRMQLFQATNVWIDNAPYVSGGVAENGSFLLLDVPPGNVTITFSAPGAPAANLTLRNIPGDADVFIPAILLKTNSVAVLQPNGVVVRLAAQVSHPTPTGATAVVAGVTVPVMNAPIASMVDRHDYPIPPSGPHAIAIVK